MYLIIGCTFAAFIGVSLWAQSRDVPEWKDW